MAAPARLALVLLLVQGTSSVQKLRIQTAVQSRFLDKKLDLDVEDDATVLDVKKAAAARFPGAPPASAQRLFLGSRLLLDEEGLRDVIEPDEEDEEDEEEQAAERLALILDGVPPADDRRPRPPDELRDRVRAYAAEVVALERSRRRLEMEFADEEDDDALTCGDVAGSISSYENTLLRAVATKIEEREANVTTGVVRDGRDRSVDPRAAFFLDGGARTFGEKAALALDLDWREAGKVGLGIFVAAQVGVKDKGRQAFLLALAPLAVLAQTRPARFLAKVLWYALPRGPQHADGFFRVLLNGPQQLVLAMDEGAVARELYRPLVVDEELPTGDGEGWTDAEDEEEEDEG